MSDIFIATQRMIAAEDAANLKIREHEVLAKAIDLLPEKLTLVYVDYDDKLMVEQMVELLEGKPIGESATLDDFEFEARCHGEDYTYKELDLNDEERQILDDSDLYDELRQAMWERDDSDIVGELIRHTPSQWMRYWFDERSLDSDELIDQVYQGVAGVGEILETLGLLNTPQHTRELEAEIADVLANAGTDNAIYLLWHAEIDPYVAASGYDYGSTPPTHSYKITWKNPYLLLHNPFMGSGYAGRITATITATYKADNLTLDCHGGGNGYSHTDEVCGGWISEDTTEVTLTKASV